MWVSFRRVFYAVKIHSWTGLQLIKGIFLETRTPSWFSCSLLFAHRGTQRQFSENICSEDHLRSRIFGIFVVKFLACLPIFNGFLPVKGHLEFSGAFFLAEIFEKVNFNPYNFRITRLSARKSEQMKNF